MSATDEAVDPSGRWSMPTVETRRPCERIEPDGEPEATFGTGIASRFKVLTEFLPLAGLPMFARNRAGGLAVFDTLRQRAP